MKKTPQANSNTLDVATEFMVLAITTNYAIVDGRLPMW